MSFVKIPVFYFAFCFVDDIDDCAYEEKRNHF